MRLNHELAKLGIHPEPIGVGLFAISCVGVALAILGNVQSWAIWQRCQQETLFLEFTNCSTLVLRTKETPPKQYKLLRGLGSNTETKAAGVLLALLGGTLSLILNNQITESLLKLEEEEEAILERETAIKEQELDLEDMVEQRALKLHYADKAKQFEALYNHEAPPPNIKEQETRSSEFQDENGDLNSDKLLTYLLQKNIIESSVSDLSRKSIYGRHVPVEELRKYLDELVAIDAVAWTGEEKLKFKLLMEF